MEQPEIKHVSIDQINLADRTYVFTYEPLISYMVTSIKRIGLLNPPILELTGNGNFRIVAGLKRIIALKHLRINEFQAIVHTSQNDKPCFDLFLLNLFDNLGTRNLNLIEKAFIIHQLIHQFRLLKEQVASDFLPLLQLGSNPKIIERYLPLIQLEDCIKISIIEETMSVETALDLLNLPEEARIALFNLFQQLKFGKNRQREFIHLLNDISKLTDMSIINILQKKEVQDILNNQQLTPPVKINRLKDFLKKLRYPEYTRIEQEFANIKKELKLPPNISLHPPAFFEGNKYTMELKFTSQREFKQLVGLLNDIIKKNKIKKIESLL